LNKKALRDVAGGKDVLGAKNVHLRAGPRVCNALCGATAGARLKRAVPWITFDCGFYGLVIQARFVAGQTKNPGSSEPGFLN
jgi:hypothetical protein